MKSFISIRREVERWNKYETIPKSSGETMIYLIRFRPFSIKDVALARMARPFDGIPPSSARNTSSKQFERLSEPFEAVNRIIDLHPHQEMWILQEIIKTHPAHIKPFEHFLIDPPANITPSRVYEALQKRSDMIPTLCAITVIDDKVREVERIDTHHDLFAKLHQAHERGWIPTELCEHLLGASRGGSK